MSRPLKTVAKEALQLQPAGEKDFALLAVMFANAMSDLTLHLREIGTTPIESHPITVLWMSQLKHATRTNTVDDLAEFRDASLAVEEIANQPDPPDPKPVTFVVFRRSENTNEWCQRGYWLFSADGHVWEVRRAASPECPEWNLKDKVHVPVRWRGSGGVSHPLWHRMQSTEVFAARKQDIPDDVYPGIVSSFGDPNE